MEQLWILIQYESDEIVQKSVKGLGLEEWFFSYFRNKDKLEDRGWPSDVVFNGSSATMAMAADDYT